MDASHPMQPVVIDEHNVARFKSNAIVRAIYEFARERGMGLNEIARMPFDREDREQFAQLLGYSVSGAADLEYVSDETIAKADAVVRWKWTPRGAEASR